MYASLKTCPDQDNKSLADSKIESAKAHNDQLTVTKEYNINILSCSYARAAALRLLLCSVRAAKTSVAQCTHDIPTIVFCCWIAIQKLSLAYVR